METLFSIQIQKADGTFVQRNVEASEAVDRVAIVAAIEAALAAAGPGAAFQSANVLGTVHMKA
jgi:hypothetical protein